MQDVAENIVALLPPLEPYGYVFSISNSNGCAFLEAKMVPRLKLNNQFVYLIRFSPADAMNFYQSKTPPKSEWQTEIATTLDGLKGSIRMFAKRSFNADWSMRIDDPSADAKGTFQELGYCYKYTGYLFFNPSDPTCDAERKLHELLSVLSNLKAPAAGPFSW